jgi:hypothetical protein
MKRSADDRLLVSDLSGDIRCRLSALAMLILTSVLLLNCGGARNDGSSKMNKSNSRGKSVSVPGAFGGAGDNRTTVAKTGEASAAPPTGIIANLFRPARPPRYPTQNLIALIKSSCAISSMSLSGNTGFQGTGGAPVGVWSPNFVCVADLDGSGTKQVIVGYQKSTAGTVNYGPPPAYEVTIINNNGTVRTTLPFPQ